MRRAKAVLRHIQQIMYVNADDFSGMPRFQQECRPHWFAANAKACLDFDAKVTR